MKPLSELGTQMAEAKEWTCADGFKVTNQELHDDGIISTLINQTLMRNLNEYLEKTILNGDSNTDVAQKGILNTTGTQQVAFDTDIFKTARHAKRVLSAIGTNIQAIVLNPEDNETIDLMQGQTGRYFGQGPFSMGPNMLWGIPRIESQALPKRHRRHGRLQHRAAAQLRAAHHRSVQPERGRCSPQPDLRARRGTQHAAHPRTEASRRGQARRSIRIRISLIGGE